jgi:hypothetical protein
MATRTDRRFQQELAIRIVLAALSLGVALWGLSVAVRPELTRAHADTVWHTTLGENFAAADMDRLRTPCDDYRRNAHPRAALLAALVAVRDVEVRLLTAPAREVQALAACAVAATDQLLQVNPASGYGWFLRAWLVHLEGGDPSRLERFLERSMDMAPREVWMAHKRIPLTSVEMMRGRFDLARRDYRSLVEGDIPESAARLLRVCATENPLCEIDWNEGLPSRETHRVWREMVRDD